MSARAIIAAAAALGAGCNEVRPPFTGTQSLEIKLLAPADPGNFAQRLPDTARTVMVDVVARDQDNEVDASFEDEVRVYAQFLGTVTPGFDQPPLARIPMTAGVASNRTIELPPSVLGPTTLWFDNGTGFGPDYEYGAIAGTSPTLWYRDPYIADLQTPESETALDALQRTPLTDKQINVRHSRYGARGRLVVTSTFAQGYTVSDVECADDAGRPPCTTNAYDHMLVFTFSQPRDQHGGRIVPGRVIEGFAGGLSEFNGLTEVGFPRTFATEGVTPVVDEALRPPPVPLATSWFGPLGDDAGRINFERNESGAIDVRDALVCPLDQEYATFKQWKLDPRPTSTIEDNQCASRDVINVITAGTDFATDPATLVGRRLPSVIGMVRPVNIGAFNVWIIYPRDARDLTLP